MMTVCASGSGGSSAAASETTSSSWSDERSTEAGEVVAAENSGELRRTVWHQPQAHIALKSPTSPEQQPGLSISIGAKTWPEGCAGCRTLQPAAGSRQLCGSQ